LQALRKKEFKGETPDDIIVRDYNAPVYSFMCMMLRQTDGRNY